MSGFKKLNQQDVYLTSYSAKKSWTVTGNNFTSEGVGISLLQPSTASSGEYIDLDSFAYTGPYDILTGSNPLLFHNSVNQLYYSGYDESGTPLSSSYYNFDQSTLLLFSKSLSDSAVLFSIPQDKFGTHIEPGSFRLYGEEFINLESEYIEPDYFIAFASGGIEDDGEGNLVFSGYQDQKVGDIIYTHGNIIITNQNVYTELTESPLQVLSWKSNQPIYTYNYNIRVSDYEFNITQNPTAQSGSTIFSYSGSNYVQPSGILADNVTGSYFQPYITSVGLYNDANELIAVAKLAQPLPKPANTELTIQIKLDI